MERQLKKARSHAEAEARRATKGEDQGYQRGYNQSIEFFQELLLTMEPKAFSAEGYFEVYVKYVEDRHQARNKG